MPDLIPQPSSQNSMQTVRVLAQELTSRNYRNFLYEHYYNGRHRLAYATSKYRDAFGTLFGAFALNYCKTAVDTVASRIEVSGFSADDSAVADAAWRLWLDGGLDGFMNTAFRQALIYGEGYITANPGDGTVVVEDSRQMIVVKNPARPTQTLLAAKYFVGGLEFAEYLAGGERLLPPAVGKRDSYAYCILYKPDSIETYRSVDPVTPVLGIEALRILWTLIDTQPNPLGEVPVYVLPFSPDAAHRGRSALSSLVQIQDAINKIGNDMLIASEFQAFRQRVLTGVEIPKDPETGKPLRDTQLEASMSRLWSFEPSDAKVYDLAPASLANYRDALEALVGSFAVVASLPPTYFASVIGGGSLSNVSGEAVAALELAHISKIEEAERLWRQPISRAVAVALGEDGRLEVEFRPVQRPSISTLADAATKMDSIGVSKEELFEMLGFSPTEIAEMIAAAPTPPMTERVSVAATDPNAVIVGNGTVT